MPQSMQFRVAVCDDDKTDREEIAGLVEAFYKTKISTVPSRRMKAEKYC